MLQQMEKMKNPWKDFDKRIMSYQCLQCEFVTKYDSNSFEELGEHALENHPLSHVLFGKKRSLTDSKNVAESKRSKLSEEVKERAGSKSAHDRKKTLHDKTKIYFKCDICGKCYTLLFKLKKHNENIHKGKIVSKLSNELVSLDTNHESVESEIPIIDPSNLEEKWDDNNITSVKSENHIVDPLSNLEEKGEDNNITNIESENHIIEPLSNLEEKGEVNNITNVGLGPPIIEEKGDENNVTLPKALPNLVVEEKPFGCEICESRFKQNKHLQRHIRTIHMGEKKYLCQICKEKFQTNSNLKRHESTIHYYEKAEKVSCGFCNKPFIRGDNLKSHESSCKIVLGL